VNHHRQRVIYQTNRTKKRNTKKEEQQLRQEQITLWSNSGPDIVEVRQNLMNSDRIWSDSNRKESDNFLVGFSRNYLRPTGSDWA
jgi:hypothetical protein